MQLTDIDPRVVQAAVAAQPAQFHTRDVSERPEMLAAHGAEERMYHALVGKHLQAHAARLGLRFVGGKSSRGALWEKLDAVRSPREPAAFSGEQTTSAPAPPDDLDLGPQFDRDPPFTARMRRHQSWYRAAVLREPCGTDKGTTTRRGSQLTTEAGERGRNFVTDEIFEVARRRVEGRRGTLDPDRLFRNMLSSQPMCFNLFAPLVADEERAARLLAPIVGGPIARVPVREIEWAPAPPADYLADRTAFDVYFEVERPDGARIALGIETKLTDSFSKEHYDRPEYRRWMRGSRSPWRADAGSRVDDVRHNQLWRDHLLAIALRDHPRSRFAEGMLALVRHPFDLDGAAAVASYERLLVEGDRSFVDLQLDEILERWAPLVRDHERPWLDAFRLRYLDLARSEGATAPR